MKFIYFTHSLASCWNHGNAHFLRGVLRELLLAGHQVCAYEPEGAWSLSNLLRDHGERGLAAYKAAYPELSSVAYDDTLDFEAVTADADVVIVHEWNEPHLITTLGSIKRKAGRFVLLFHDTHHRTVSDAEAIARLGLDDYDAVLAFGATLAEVYRRLGWGQRAFVWHEAADVRLFRPPETESSRSGLVWIGNWGDGERSAELLEYLLKPAAASGLPLDIYGVRYPDEALKVLAQHGAAFRGWLPNARAPFVYASHCATVHVPRRFYVEHLPGIPTIRVFEALACGIPLISSPWSDEESLFKPGEDFLLAGDSQQMAAYMTALAADHEFARALATSGLARIRARHTCAHRASGLIQIISRIQNQPVSELVA